MKIKKNLFRCYQRKNRSGIWVYLRGEENRYGFGEVAPLPFWSQESLDEAYQQLHKIRKNLYEMDWKEPVEQLSFFSLFPSVRFGLESALYGLLCGTEEKKDPSYLSNLKILHPTSFLLMGSFDEMIHLAKFAEQQGYLIVKVKLKGLSFDQSRKLIDHLHGKFRLRIDVNRSWKTKEALSFFSSYPLDFFDYVEEPLENPKDLEVFSHPLAIDESFPQDLNLLDLEKLSSLKALIYKPTLQGGYLNALPLIDWCKKRGIDFVLSSSFETKRGLLEIRKMAKRLSLQAPLGIGTESYFS